MTARQIIVVILTASSLLVTVLAAGAAVVYLGVGFSYLGPTITNVLMAAISAALVLFAIVYLVRTLLRFGKPWSGFKTHLLATSEGVVLCGFGAYALYFDRGDWVLWIWFFLFGLSLLVVVAFNSQLVWSA